MWTDAARTWTSTSSSLGTGSSTSWTLRASRGSPYRSWTSAFWPTPGRRSCPRRRTTRPPERRTRRSSLWHAFCGWDELQAVQRETTLKRPSLHGNSMASPRDDLGRPAADGRRAPSRHATWTSMRQTGDIADVRRLLCQQPRGPQPTSTGHRRAGGPATSHHRVKRPDLTASAGAPTDPSGPRGTPNGNQNDRRRPSRCPPAIAVGLASGWSAVPAAGYGPRQRPRSGRSLMALGPAASAVGHDGQGRGHPEPRKRR